MTGDEMERTMEFILQSQANHEARLGALSDRINQLSDGINQLTLQNAETNRIVQLNADNLSVLIGIVTQNIEAQAEINASLRASNNRADEKLQRLAEIVERHIVDGHGNS